MTVDPYAESPARPHPATIAATAFAFVAYFVLLHVLIASRTMPLLALLVVAAPWIVAVVSLPLRSIRLAALAGRASRVSIALVMLAAIGAIGWRYADALAMHAELALYLENLGFLCALSALFAISLRGRHEALVTRLARRVRNGDMPPPVVAYTRSATVAWAVFFAAMAIVSTALFVTGSRTVWSAFVNLAVWPLTATMFLLEYIVRLRVLRGYAHGSLMTGVRAFRQHARDADGERR